jgi:hypothetical protein
VATKKFQSVVGKMRHIATILPSARALFTPLNRALRMTPHTIALSATGEVQAALLDLRQLITTLAVRPTHVNEILPASEPDYIGYCEARSAPGESGLAGSARSRKQSGGCSGRRILPRPLYLRATQPGREQIQTWRWQRWCYSLMSWNRSCHQCTIS